MIEPRLIVPPAVDPLPLEQAFVELRLAMPGDDLREHPDYQAVRAKLRAATAHCEGIAHRSFVRQTLRVVGTPETLSASARRFAGSDWWHDAGFELPRPPAQEVVSINYLDSDGAEQTVDPGDYYLHDDPSRPRVFFLAGYALPALSPRRDAMRIDYVAGYPAGEPDEDYDPDLPPQHLAANVPAPVAQAVLLTLRLLYQDLTPDDRAATERARDDLLSHCRLRYV